MQEFGGSTSGSVAAPVVAGRRRRVRVPDESLDSGQVRSGVEQIAYAGPTEIVRAEGRHARRDGQAPNELHDGLTAHRSQDDATVLPYGREEGADLRPAANEPAVDGLARAARHEDPALLVPFAPHEHGPRRGDVVSDLESDGFGPPSSPRRR